MIRLQQIHSANSDGYRFMEQLLTEAFPQEEYRKLSEIRRLTEAESIFHNNLIFEGEIPVGFITHWSLDVFCYIEHFAIRSGLRNKGYGKDVIALLRQHIHIPIVLEVELPVDEMTRRRIGFYERQGFTLWRHKYTQPPYRQGGKQLDLYLMVCGELDERKDFDRVRREIHKIVYGYET